MVDKIWYNMEELIGGSEERVLIETYWNVKGFTIIELLPPGFVLIETYWNVKLYPFSPPFSLLRINRNILECKGQTRSNDNEDDGY